MSTLVWRKGLKGPTAAINTVKTLDETDRNALIARYELNGKQETLLIDELVKLYPCPQALNADGDYMVIKPLKS